MTLDELREDFLGLIRDFGEHKDRLEALIAEYKKWSEALIIEHRATVNRTFMLLYQELEADRKSRISRQKKQDIKDYALIGCGVLTLAAACSIIFLLAYLLIGNRTVSL